MTITVDCHCGTTLTIDDASEEAAGSLLDRWNHAHKNHRRTLEEYGAYLWMTHRGKDEGWPDAAGPGWTP